MPHTASAAKRLRKSERRRRRNRANAKNLKQKRKELQVAVTGKDAAAIETAYKTAQATVDRAAAKGYIHPNKAARLKSRMIKRIRAAKNAPAKA
jgi:small subunit ribosomal protein S20